MINVLSGTIQLFTCSLSSAHSSIHSTNICLKKCLLNISYLSNVVQGSKDRETNMTPHSIKTNERNEKEARCANMHLKYSKQIVCEVGTNDLITSHLRIVEKENRDSSH